MGRTEGRTRHVPRQNVTSRTVTVMQYRTDAQYVPMAEAKGMKTNHVAGTPLTGEGVGVSVQNMMGHQKVNDEIYQGMQRRAIRP